MATEAASCHVHGLDVNEFANAVAGNFAPWTTRVLEGTGARGTIADAPHLFDGRPRTEGERGPACRARGATLVARALRRPSQRTAVPAARVANESVDDVGGSAAPLRAR